jgi:hypothetical protein
MRFMGPSLGLDTYLAAERVPFAVEPPQASVCLLGSAKKLIDWIGSISAAYARRSDVKA